MKKEKSMYCIVVLAGICLLLGIGSKKLASGGALADGRYAVEVKLSGGSGKASVMTPTLLVAEGGAYYAEISWNSPNYDYMVVAGKRYDNLSEEGSNSSFQIPVLAFDEEMPVLADTTAMGEPMKFRIRSIFIPILSGQRAVFPKKVQSACWPWRLGLS